MTLYSEAYFRRGKYVKDRAIENSCRRRVNWLKQNGIRSGSRVLDVGCATGDFIAFGKDHFDMWGVDISRYAVEAAKRDNPDMSDHISCQDIEDIQFPDEFFDAIVLWDVLEHLRAPLSSFSTLVRFLKTGGIIAFSTPNVGAPIARLLGKYWPLMTVPEHLHFFDRNTVRLLNAKVGLKTMGWMSKGTWANVGFLVYKVAKVAPVVVPASLLDKIRKSFLSNCVVYVPTGDIQFVAAQKMSAMRSI
ncbi:MAG: class I SAM-dependent methyltransferase [Planctomycetota bacterium]|jgi:2-polyprenyl-3-methyl-5-hydroxy-6-metoxy-1,4-benzoquinol methylase